MFFVWLPVPSHTRVESNEEHPEQAGGIHRVVLPRVHLRPQPVAPQQSAGWSRGDQTPTTDALPIE